MERVHGGRHPVGPRRGPAEHAGLGLVRVHDVGAELPDDPADLVERPDVAPGMRFAAEADHGFGLQVRRPQRGVVTLLRADRPDEQALVEAGGVQPPTEHGRLERGPTDIEPVDDAEHTDGRHRPRLRARAHGGNG